MIKITAIYAQRTLNHKNVKRLIVTFKRQKKAKVKMMKDAKIQPFFTLKWKEKCKDAKGNKVKEETPVFSNGDALELLLNTTSKLDMIKSQYNFHAKGKTKFHLQLIGRALEDRNAAKHSKPKRTRPNWAKPATEQTTGKLGMKNYVPRSVWPGCGAKSEVS